jgi:hypothetical protein
MTTSTAPEISIDEKLLAQYLNVYLGDIGVEEWAGHIRTLHKIVKRKSTSDSMAAETWRKAISCAILLPEYDRSVLTDPPENLLYWCQSYRQMGDRDWYQLFKQRVSEDAKIESVRKKVQSMGIIYPLDYSPITRQALHWLVDKSQGSGQMTDQNKKLIISRFEKLVYAYGGNVICGVFNKTSGIEKKVLNWKTSYFFERLIFTIYSPEQIVKIKAGELKKTHPKLVKQITIKEQ